MLELSLFSFLERQPCCVQEFFSKSIPLDSGCSGLGPHHKGVSTRMLGQHFTRNSSESAFHQVSAYGPGNRFAHDKTKAGMRHGLIPL